MFLYLVRHGQSVGNEKKAFHGQNDYPLTEEGRRQAAEAAKKLRGVTFSRCCASDMRRAWDTALICLEGREVVPEECPALREQEVGPFEGVSWEQMQNHFPDIMAPFTQDWFHTTPPGGESPDDMIRRVSDCVDGIIARGEDTLIVAHNGSLSLILRHLGLAKEEQLFKPGWFFQQGTYSTIRVDENGAELVGFNQ